ncbi:YaaA family protein [Planctomonas psychrotolerans]|uniref:YaaA family protein n=1 Tax=Planctomonas psychrotolerans TaxID=2528712 RepID=UPI00123BE9AA|nr:peroxide stress protein YaaA [Planctomonas psychrotolerans]
MLIVLPPSETKRDGGDGPPLDLAALGYPALNPQRRTVLRATRALARNRAECMAALRLGPSLAAEVDRNRAVTRSATLPAIDRYTGVLFDALDASSLSEAARGFAHRHLAIHSALLGPVRALDPIPAYRLSYDSRLPDLPLRAQWAAPVRDQLAATSGVILDLRSAGYAGLGPAPVRSGSSYLRVVTRAEDGVVRALNHFNKAAKGRFARAILETAVDLPDTAAVLDWARDAGFDLRPGRAGELDLVVS